MIDVKSTGTGHVVSYYDYNFNGANYQNGGVNFCKDEELYARLDAILQEPSDEKILSLLNSILKNKQLCMDCFQVHLHVGYINPIS